MEKEYMRSVIILVTGAKFPDEHMSEYLFRFSEYTGIHYDTVRVAWYGTAPLSKKAKEKFEWAAQHVGQPNELIDYTERHITVWEANASRHRQRIDAARCFVDALRLCSEPAGAGDVQTGRSDVGGGAGREAACAGLAPAAAAKT